MNHPNGVQNSSDKSVIFQHYVDIQGQAVHYRKAGNGPAVILLHDSPRSSRLHLNTMQILSQYYSVYALDTPGYGNSAPLDIETPTIADFAAALHETISHLGLNDAPLYATHTSAKIALEYAAAYPRTAPLILDGLSIPVGPPNDSFINAYMRPVTIEATGGYLAAEWTRMRDMVRWFPWFDLSAKSRMAIPAATDAWLADYAIDYFAAGSHYSDAYKAAMYYDPMPALLKVASPVIVAARSDDVLYSSLDRVPAKDNPNLVVERLGADRDLWMQWMIGALQSSANDPETAPPRAADAARWMVDLPDGRLHIYRAGPADGVPILLLSTPTILQGLAWQKALPNRPTLLPELPGFGESTPLPHATLDAVADRLIHMLDAANVDQIDILASDLTAGLAALLASKAPNRVRSLIFDGCPLIAGEEAADLTQNIAPAFAFDGLGGSHNHRYWHMLRDSEANFPWFSGEPQSQRSTSPNICAQSLHSALTGILKQPDHYGDVARAGILAQAEDQTAVFTAPCLIFQRGNDPVYAGAARLAEQVPHAISAERPADIADAAQQINLFLGTLAPAVEAAA